MKNILCLWNTKQNMLIVNNCELWMQWAVIANYKLYYNMMDGCVVICHVNENNDVDYSGRQYVYRMLHWIQKIIDISHYLDTSLCLLSVIARIHVDIRILLIFHLSPERVIKLIQGSEKVWQQATFFFLFSNIHTKITAILLRNTVFK